jgi:hypothetical protein
VLELVRLLQAWAPARRQEWEPVQLALVSREVLELLL